MIKFEEALNIIIKSVKTLDAESVQLEKSLGLILAEDVVSDMNMPPFDKSAMDGYACRYDDINNELEVIELIAAGEVPEKKIEKNQCSKIMTGAMIPEGADCVLMIEHTKETEEGKIIYTKKVKEIEVCNIEPSEKRQLNICYMAEDIKKGDVVIKKGIKIQAQDVATMASVGYVLVSVAKIPRVAVIPTGNEIVEPNLTPSVSQIRNSNGAQLVAQLKNIGIDAWYNGIARDTEAETMKMIEDAYQENDIILLTGGVSKGDYDLVPEILQKLKFELLFQEIAVQPGKPTVFGVRENKYCFGLPGNPVSSFVQFEMLVKPLIYSLMNQRKALFDIRLPLSKDYWRKRVDRLA
ncbi:MAG: molybdopterin molybdotransferase MoeA, partial [Bacteroidales bacterium]|nr:molybdopterin molybdotransferase MoeA [Bacteroidales bacterium]